MRTKSVMIATNVNVSNAIKSSARSVFTKTNMSINVTTVIKAIAGDAMTAKKLIFTHAVDAISNVAMIADSKGIDRDCIAQNVSNIVCRF